MYIVRVGLGLGNSSEIGEPLNLDFTTPGSCPTLEWDEEETH